MRRWIVLILLCCLGSPAWAGPDILELFDWKSGPDEVLRSLQQDESNKAKLKMFHKTGVRYIKAQLTTLGNHWDSTVYFDEQDLPNQLLLQLEKVTRSGNHRIQHLALEEFGEDYESTRRKGDTRDDLHWLWKRDGFEIKLTTAQYHSDQSLTVWLAIKPNP